MGLKITDLLTDHRFIILVDIREYSNLSDDEELQVIEVITIATQKFIKEGGYEKENIFSAFIPTGDGFYIVGNEMIGLFWGQMSIMFAISLRNVLLEKFQKTKSICKGVKIAIHFGATKTFIDIAGHKNYVGAGMNDTARLLSYKNKSEIDAILKSFYKDENSIIISNDALARIPERKSINLSTEFTIIAKHGRKIVCRFIDVSQDHVYNVISLG